MPDNRHPIGPFKIGSDQLVILAVTQHHGMQFWAFHPEHVNEFAGFIGKSECFIVPTDFKPRQFGTILGNAVNELKLKMHFFSKWEEPGQCEFWQ